MFRYRAVGTPINLRGQYLSGVNLPTQNDLTIWGMPQASVFRQGPPVYAPPYRKGDAQASATSQNSAPPRVDSAELSDERQFVVVSGLTYCIGLIAGRWNVSNFPCACVAHFNGNYDDKPAWEEIKQVLNSAGGEIIATIIATSDSTEFDVGTYGGMIESRLLRLGARPENILLYWSNTSGIAFIMNARGFIGETDPRFAANNFNF